MIVSYHKEKAFNAITFFLTHTGMCNKKKTYKLLWLLDSEHFASVGRGVTGYDYFAWKMGPVPTELHEAIESNDPELTEYFDIEKLVQGVYVTITLKNKRPFEKKYFSKRELALLKDLANRFDMASGEEMEEWTHREGTPWHRVWVLENRKQAEIPFEYALSRLQEDDRKAILGIVEERQEFLANYSNELRNRTS
jgi:uncharacterized phage-associated protein